MANRIENRKVGAGYQWAKFLEHCGWFVTVFVALLGAEIVGFFARLSGTSWIWFFVLSFAVMIFGGGLIGYPKIPVYRSGRYFTFGTKSVPAELTGYYRWGWRLFLFGVVLGLCLLFSRP